MEEESKMYGDIVILNITENMNQGKTFEYFNWFAKHREDNYLLKLDDDTFLHLIHYYRDLQDLPRERAYYGNALGYEHETYAYMGGAGYTLSRDLVIDIVRSNWVNSNVEGNEDWLVGEWVCHVAREMKYFVHYVGFTSWVPSRQNPIHDFDENLDLHFLSETIMIHQVKNIEKLKAIKDVYSEYEEGFPIVRVIRNSTVEGLATKREVIPRCWTALEIEQIWDQLQSTYKNCSSVLGDAPGGAFGGAFGAALGVALGATLGGALGGALGGMFGGVFSGDAYSSGAPGSLNGGVFNTGVLGSIKF
ncbi:3707_t:CDS:2 [Dentiscutata heterogama]|uniref:3707_t:CDS:1 n=1 Tax=Dentiscutata heterogama TaxID=1316150 RepID=A0ACA9JZI6_9GLOM|nr:3707_t:CDS:2 [Dentiscutata heterogama]